MAGAEKRFKLALSRTEQLTLKPRAGPSLALYVQSAEVTYMPTWRITNNAHESSDAMVIT